MQDPSTRQTVYHVEDIAEIQKTYVDELGQKLSSEMDEQRSRYLMENLKCNSKTLFNDREVLLLSYSVWKKVLMLEKCATRLRMTLEFESWTAVFRGR